MESEDKQSKKSNFLARSFYHATPMRTTLQKFASVTRINSVLAPYLQVVSLIKVLTVVLTLITNLILIKLHKQTVHTEKMAGSPCKCTPHWMGIKHMLFPEWFESTLDFTQQCHLSTSKLSRYFIFCCYLLFSAFLIHTAIGNSFIIKIKD